jgi:hypothetical protein
MKLPSPSEGRKSSQGPISPIVETDAPLAG